LVRRKRARRGPNTKPSSLSACYLGHFADRAVMFIQDLSGPL